jgi:hypothetical protein
MFLIYKEIQSGAIAKSYMRKGFLIWEKCANVSPYMRRPLVIYDFATACSILNFLIYEENLIFYFISAANLRNSGIWGAGRWSNVERT